MITLEQVINLTLSSDRIRGPTHPRRPKGSQSGREKRRDESFQVRADKSLGPLGTDSQKFKRMPAPDWAQEMLCIIVPNRRTVSSELLCSKNPQQRT